MLKRTQIQIKTNERTNSVNLYSLTYKYNVCAAALDKRKRNTAAINIMKNAFSNTNKKKQKNRNERKKVNL